MRKKLEGKLAEEILTNDDLQEKFEKLNKDDSHIKNENLKSTQIIYNSIRGFVQKLDKKEKRLLGQQISNSISRHKKQRLWAWVSSSAAVFILVFGVYMFEQQRDKDIIEFANNITAQPKDDNTRIIINGKEEIEIESKESKIEYLASGTEIKIDTDKKVEQVIEKEEIVYNTIIVPYGKRTQITLSDSSTIWLNSGSKLIYPAGFKGSKREVYLEGEGVFEVSKNEKKPFYVITRDVEIKVLGTVFNISAYDDDNFSSTVLESGSVELKYKSNTLLKQSKITMVPGTMAVYFTESKDIVQKEVDTRNYTCWKEGYIILHNESMLEITKRLSRYYNVSIVLENESLKAKTFSGRLDLKNSADIVLQIIAETSNFKITSNENEIIIN
ncbi:FecR family protein [Maribellus maritimus]|uniref:FecR family protein n=1 Tax=Maribellus maritimus TaxID=2870838 RepID=UPI001EEC4387|nr:FecR family protein [Maribellus maritimus]MCG6190053.1 FecR domain-containing protein [Maribellus maritimus]